MTKPVHQMRADLEAERIKAQEIGNIVGESIVRMFLPDKSTPFTQSTIEKMVKIYLDYLVESGAMRLFDFAVQCDAHNNTPFMADQGKYRVDLALKISEDGGMIFVPVDIKPRKAEVVEISSAS